MTEQRTTSATFDVRPLTAKERSRMVRWAEDENIPRGQKFSNAAILCYEATVCDLERKLAAARERVEDLESDALDAHVEADWRD